MSLSTRLVQTPPTTQTKAGYGLIGLGPQTGSEVRGAINSSAGDPVLDRIFRQNTTTPNYLTILLGRSDDPTDTLPGDITVGEILPGYENITSQPKLNVSVVPSDDTDNQHWQTLLDADGIIGPDGNAIDVETSVSSTSNKKQLTAVFDTGFSIPQVPRYADSRSLVSHHHLTCSSFKVQLQRRYTATCPVRNSNISRI